MSDMIKFTKIGQFRDVQHEVKRNATFIGLDEDGEPQYNPSLPLPTLTFKGTVKLHGTNAGVALVGGEIQYQSRNRILTVDSDNYGFAKFASEVSWADLFNEIGSDFGDTTAVYGEWCGHGIQTKVAISELPRMFVVFAIRHNGEWLDLKDIEARPVPFIVDYETFDIEIDFNKPEQANANLIEVTAAVESECPVAAAHGVLGVGEGVVWACADSDYKSLMFKVKGEEHSKTRVRKLNPVDAERIGRSRDIAESLMTEERLEQGMEYLREMNLPKTRRSLGDFLKYVVSDCIAEEAIRIEEAGLEKKDIGKHLSEVAKTWFFRMESEAA